MGDLGFWIFNFIGIFIGVVNEKRFFFYILLYRDVRKGNDKVFRV